MKKKSKIAIAATAVAITSLIITAYHPEPISSPVSSQIASMSEVVAESRTCTPPIDIEPIVVEEITQISTQTKEITKPTHQQEVTAAENETPSSQPTEKEITDTTPTTDTQTPTKPTTPPPAEPNTSKNGDTRFVDRKQQSYLLGFGWVEYMGENEYVYEEGMYENGNKVGVMD
jgi:uncharacterized membrane protein